MIRRMDNKSKFYEYPALLPVTFVTYKQKNIPNSVLMHQFNQEFSLIFRYCVRFLFFPVRDGVNRQRVNLFLLLFLVTSALPSHAAIDPSIVTNPLEPAHTQSPRSTLEGFLSTMDERFNVTFGKGGVLRRYLDSGNLYADERELQPAIAEMLRAKALSTQYLDLSALPPATVDEASWRLCIQLKEILDRIDLPPLNNVPDDASLESKPIKRWTIPGTEIRIGLIESGPRVGEFVFTQDTVNQIPAFYERVKDLPYKGGNTEGMYDMVFGHPTGVALALRKIIPPRWFFSLPEWIRTPILGQPFWQWLCVIVVLGFFAAAIWSLHYYAKHRSRRDDPKTKLWTVLPSLMILILIPITQYLLGEVIRLSPTLFTGITLALWVIFYLTLPWVIWIVGGVFAEWIIGNERIPTENIDAQLIRLGFRLVSILLAIGIIIEGANRVGLPSYSVIAGLGIGGLAMALAGQQALANLLGSLIIMLEKPFRVGHSIKTSGIEGRVEDIGFRSTRMRTPDNTLVIVPSASLVNSTIENLTLRKSWRVKRTIYLKFGTAMSNIRDFKSQVKALLLDDKDIKAETVKVALNEIGLNGFELIVDYTLSARDERERTKIMDQIMNAIGDIAESNSIEFGKSDQ